MNAAELPSVGELVQITKTDGSKALAVRDNEQQLDELSVVGDWPVELRDVQSWCRVLVVPDTEEIRDLVRRTIFAHVWGEDYSADEADCCANAVLAAVRGAAIR